jgi:acyl-ACP thioesterase
MPSRISDDFLQALQRTTDIHRLRWTAYLKPGNRDNATQVWNFPVRFTDIDLFDHMNNCVYWSVVEDYLSATPDLLKAPLRVIIEHEAPIALGDKLDIIAHVHPAGSTGIFGSELINRPTVGAIGNEALRETNVSAIPVRQAAKAQVNRCVRCVESALHRRCQFSNLVSRSAGRRC